MQQPIEAKGLLLPASELMFDDITIDPKLVSRIGLLLLTPPTREGTSSPFRTASCHHQTTGLKGLCY